MKALITNITGLRPATLLKKILWHRCFPVNFTKLLRTPFLQNTSGWLLLDFQIQTQIWRNVRPVFSICVTVMKVYLLSLDMNLRLNLKIFQEILSKLHGNYQQYIEDESDPNLGKSVTYKQSLGYSTFARKWI